MTATPDGDLFIARVPALPPELCSEIHNVAFTINGGDVNLDKKWKRPATLAISRVTRANVAGAFYADTIFRVSSRNCLLRWLTMTPPSHPTGLGDTCFSAQFEDADVVREEANDLLDLLGYIGGEKGCSTTW